MFERMDHQHAIDAGIGKRQIFIKNQRRRARLADGPMHRPLTSRHESQCAFTVGLEQIEIGSCIAEANQPFIGDWSPKGRQRLSNQTTGMAPHGCGIKLTKVDYVHMHR